MIITPELTENIVFDLINSSDKFSVDFDSAWQWLEFSERKNAKQSLIGCNFEEGEDFCYSLINQGIEIKGSKTAKSINKKAGESEKIWLTTDCFKTWGMMARTQKGKEVRKYFLECEKRVKSAAQPAVIKLNREEADLFEITKGSALPAYMQALSTIYGIKAEERGLTRTVDRPNAADISRALDFVTAELWAAKDRDEECDDFEWAALVTAAFASYSPKEACKWLAENSRKNTFWSIAGSYQATREIEGANSHPSPKQIL
jgi:phage anti-repressor protein